MWIPLSVAFDKYMPIVKAPDGRDMYTSFEPGSEYHGGPGGGRVVRKFLCGMHYEGHYEDDQENGNGKLLMADGAWYDGEWKDGSFHGQGTQRTASGSVYIGQHCEGKRHGQGTLTLAANQLGARIYRGAFVDNQRHGWGSFTVEKPSRGGTAIYEGEWDHDQQTGRGYLLGADDPGCVDLDGAATLEITRFVNGKKVGEGVRWCDPRKIVRDKKGAPANEYRDPRGQRVQLPQSLFYGPWRLMDGKEAGEIDDRAATAIAKSLGLTVPSFPFAPLGADPAAPDGAVAEGEGEENVEEA